ncbi:hypothetical protein CAOG_007129 [Capsaspora owczarzaki ATCC 30864]|uniref:GPI mannosyltransferase 2 n=1 Tax=Capsaspora owczarzaki (strain ATCC 30864) TaxID=595528 RepID=A0A0D2UPD5_CAPO3|nr:hypothetical protein CAOG_007129 [Capsaspora owczarzaki ATCC 30864]
MAADAAKVASLATASRIVILAAQAALNAAIEDYDTSGPIGVVNQSRPEVQAALGGLARWDGVYMLRIAQMQEYEFEQISAFFPLYPAIVHAVGWMLGGSASSLLIAAAFVSNVCFVIATIGLFLLSKRVLNTDRHAGIVAALFMLNPANIFFSAAYTESLFAALTFWAFYFAERAFNPVQSRRAWLWHGTCAITLALSSLNRGNGMVSVALPLFLLVSQLRHNLLYQPQRRRVRLVLGNLLLACFYVTFAVGPFLWWQYRSYHEFCTSPEATRPWCSQSLPFIYSFVQEHYWNNGFLRYYELKQVPNFVLALPILVLAFATVGNFALTTLAEGRLRDFVLQGRTFQFAHCIWNSATFPYIVLTRFLCASCPAIFFGAANIVQPIKLRTNNTKNTTHSVMAHPTGIPGLQAIALVAYFVLYSMLGCLLFPNFYPWT